MSLKARLKAHASGKTLSNEARFLKGWLRNPLKTGAVLPSSRALARVMASQLPAAALSGEEVVVELGPGTGVVTAALLERGVEESRLVLIEYSADFCTLLKARFPRATVVEGDAYEPGTLFEAALGGRSIAAVVSSLPLMARLEGPRESALRNHLSRMAPGRPFIQFTYAPSLPVQPERVGAKVAVTPWVKLNLPPARVLVYSREANAPGGD